MPVEFFPVLSLHVQALVRSAYGLLMVLTLLSVLPVWRTFFLTERHGGYVRSTPLTDALQNPRIVPGILGVWILASILLVGADSGIWTVSAAVLNFVFCYWFFIAERWNSLLRGMGAPGFLAWWGATAVLLLESALQFAPQLRNLTLLTLQVDFALIMLSAGIYKMTAGYLSNNGMEFGLVNPQWGYWWRAYRRIPTTHVAFRIFNHLAWATEVLGATLMLIPETRFFGGALIAVSFVYILTHIRLGWLCETVIVCTLLFLPTGHPIDAWLGTVLPKPVPAGGSIANGVSAVLLHVAESLLWAYLILRPITLAGLWYNFYAGKSLPDILQRALEKYANLFGIILWRVFTREVTNFFVEIRAKGEDDKFRMISHYESVRDRRYNLVAEAITVATIFTAPKYFSESLFTERLLRYAKSLAQSSHATLFRFTYVSILKEKGRFTFRPVVEYSVDVETEVISERVIDPAIAGGFKARSNAAQECLRPGSYLPVVERESGTTNPR